MKLNIIGKGSGWHTAPYNGVETWGITQLILRRPVDLVIDMNVYDDLRWGEVEKAEADAAKKLCEINDIPYVHLGNYPIVDVMKCFDTDYFTSTIDYALALALMRGYEEINLYGVTLDEYTDYYRLKCGADFWCGMAKGMGKKVNIHGESTIMKTFDGLVYGYDTKQL